MPNDNEEQVVLKGEAHKVVTKSPETTTGPFDWVPQLFGQISNFFLQKKPSPKQDCLSSNCSELLSKLNLQLRFEQTDENGGKRVKASNFHFLVGQKTHVSGTVGQGFGITVTVVIVTPKGKKPSMPTGLMYKWQVKPIGNQSGTVTPPTETGASCSFIPQVTAAQRKFITPQMDNNNWAIPTPSKPISYEVSVTVSCKNTTDSTTISATIKQDCRDIIRQEYVDSTMFGKSGKKIFDAKKFPIPTREEIVTPQQAQARVIATVTAEWVAAMGAAAVADVHNDQEGKNAAAKTRDAALQKLSLIQSQNPDIFNSYEDNDHTRRNNNYVTCANNQGLILDAGMVALYYDVLVEYQRLKGTGTLIFESAWRCPSRNLAVGGALNSDHQSGKAIDLQPSNHTSQNFQILYKAGVNVTKNSPYNNGRQVLLEKGTKILHLDIKTTPSEANAKIASHVHVGFQ